jgi:hypothetical protein
LYIFSAENHFPLKILWNFLEKRFFETFSAENSIFFPNIFGGKIFRGIFTKVFPEKMYKKLAPGHTELECTHLRVFLGAPRFSALGRRSIPIRYPWTSPGPVGDQCYDLYINNFAKNEELISDFEFKSQLYKLFWPKVSQI